MCLVREIGRRFVHITAHKPKDDTFLSSYWVGKTKYDVTDADIRAALKFAAGALNYPELTGIPIDRIDTHSLNGGGTNALSGYSDREIQKMSR